MGRKDKGDTHSGRGIGDSTTQVKRKENLRTIGVDKSIELIQRCVLLGSARILRKVLERATGSKVKRRTLLGFAGNWLLPGANEN